MFSLAVWFNDVLKRVDQLKSWTAGSVDLPKSVWISGLFNAKAFVTSVMQTYARSKELPLDVMKFMTEVTSKTSPSSVSDHAKEGAYVHGLCLEGARWDVKAGVLKDSLPKELHQAMPVILIKPVTADKYDLSGYLQTPVYMNMQRANVYSPQVGFFTLKTKDKPRKWILASVALLLQDELA